MYLKKLAIYGKPIWQDIKMELEYMYYIAHGNGPKWEYKYWLKNRGKL